MIAVITALLQGSYRFGDARDGDEVEATRSVCVCVCVCVCLCVCGHASDEPVGRTDGRQGLTKCRAVASLQQMAILRSVGGQR